jgi:uncharacterized protein involved in exopolysaccharide biosynthesis
MNDSLITKHSRYETTTLRDMLGPIFRRRHVAVISFLGVFLGFIIAATFLSNYYQSEFEILVNRERLDPMVTTEQTNQPSQMASAVTAEEVNSEIELLRSPDLLRRVVLANGLQEKEKRSLMSLWVSKLSEEAYIAKAVERLSGKLQILAVNKTNDISVSYRTTDPHVAYGVMNSLASLYMDKHLTVHRPRGSLDFFSNETEKYRKALANSEAKLSNFGVDDGIAAPDVVRTYMAQQMALFEGGLQQAKQAVAADEKRIIELETQMETTPHRSATQEISSQETILLQQLKASLLAAKLKRTELLMKYDPNYPLVREADQEIEETEASILDAQKNHYLSTATDRDPTYELLRTNLSQARADLASQKANVAAAQTSIQSIQLKMVNLDQKAVKQTGLIREAKADESNYLLYLSKREQERTLDALDQKRIANVAIVTPPILPALPVFGRSLILAIGFLCAAFISVGAALTLDYLDVSFRTPSDVIETLDLPILASVPKQADSSWNGLTDHDNREPVARVAKFF